jgi:hypothetical protein
MGGGDLAPRLDECPTFLHDMDAFCVWFAVGDEQDCASFTFGTCVAARMPLGYFPPVRHQMLHNQVDQDAHVNGIVVSNHCTSPASAGVFL